jgi:hypothetical protein
MALEVQGGRENNIPPDSGHTLLKLGGQVHLPYDLRHPQTPDSLSLMRCLQWASLHGQSSLLSLSS